MDDELHLISLNKKAWNKVAEKYSSSNYNSINPLVEYFCDELPENGSILDLGSGSGLPFAELFVKKGFNYLGVDISSQMIKIAQKNVPLASFKELSMTDLNFDNVFDGVFASYSMLLLSPQLFQDVAKRIVKSLKKDGLIYISLNEPRVKDIDLDMDVICEIMGETMYSRAYTEQEVLNVFSLLDLKCLKIYRDVLNSEEFGVEHMIVFIFRKIA